MATSACNRRHEPSYEQHTAVDDVRRVVLDVAVTIGAVSERPMPEPQVDAVRETTGRAIRTVTADAGYAYAKVFDGLEHRGIDPVIPTRKDPSRSGVPLRRFRYHARHHLVRCPRARILQPVRRLQRGQVFLSRVSDCARGGARRISGYTGGTSGAPKAFTARPRPGTGWGAPSSAASTT